MSTTATVRALGALALAATASASKAGIVGAGGAIEHVVAPADARLEAFTSPERIRVWDERQHTMLDRDLWTDAAAPGLYDEYADLGDHLIPAGTGVSSFYVHFDTPAAQGGWARGTVTFAARILGVIARGDGPANGPARLGDSDFLGAGTIYPQSVPYRGLEFQTDWFAISPNGRTLTVDLRVGKPGDYLRVITSVPAPGAAAALMALGLAATRRRRH